MNGICSCIIATSIYSEIPVPTVEWIQERMHYMMCLLPMVGIMEGLVVGAWFYADLDVLGFAPWTTALVGTYVPILVTRGIHMDGFPDTMNTLHSYDGRPKKLEILKNPRLGAFAVTSTAVYMMLYLGAASECALFSTSRQKGAGMVLYAVPLLFFVTERALSGLSVVWLPPVKKDGLAAGFAWASKKKLNRLVLVLWLVLCTVLATATCLTARKGAGVLAAFVGGVQFLVFGWHYRTSIKEFGGITDDLAGCFLQICELASFWVLVILVRTGSFALWSWWSEGDVRVKRRLLKNSFCLPLEDP